jgi:hypothetical protein
MQRPRNPPHSVTPNKRRSLEPEDRARLLSHVPNDFPSGIARTLATAKSIESVLDWNPDISTHVLRSYYGFWAKRLGFNS